MYRANELSSNMENQILKSNCTNTKTNRSQAVQLKSTTVLMTALYILRRGSKFLMYNSEPISEPCGPNAALLPADDRAALCFSLQERGGRKKGFSVRRRGS